MTIIAFDGKNVCIDEQLNSNDLVSAGVKYRISKKGELLAFTGSSDLGSAKMLWFDAGARKKSFPKGIEGQEDPDTADMIVFPLKGNVFVYYQQTTPVQEPGVPSAWGAGAATAMGAMLAGKTAMEAIEIVFSVNSSCGIGYVTFSQDESGKWQMVSRKKCTMMFNEVKEEKLTSRKKRK